MNVTPTAIDVIINGKNPPGQTKWKEYENSGPCNG